MGICNIIHITELLDSACAYASKARSHIMETNYLFLLILLGSTCSCSYMIFVHCHLKIGYSPTYSICFQF